MAYMYITIFVQGRLMQLSTSNNIISTPWGQQLYMSMLMHRGGGRGGRGVAYIWRGDLTEGFLHYEFRGLIHGGDCLRNFTVVL